MIQAVRRYLGTRYGVFAMRWSKDTQQELTSFYSQSKNALVIMPEDVQAAEVALTVVKFLESKFQGQNCIVIASPHSANLVSQYTNAKVVRMKESDLSYFYLPRRSFTDRFTKRQYDLVIDLNLGFVLFAAYLSRRIQSRYRVGFAKEHSDHFYNIQFRYVSGQSKQLTYNSLCEFLDKF